MKLTVFAKKIQLEGKKSFVRYLTTLKRKDGSELKVAVKFREECGEPKPENCPCNIIVDKAHANLNAQEYTAKDGLPAISYTMWVSAWSEGEAYVDNSLDEFED